MDTKTGKKKSSYREPLLLIAFVILGAVLGLTLGERVSFLYPIGQIWLNMLFVLLVPLIFSLSPVPLPASPTQNGWVNCWRSPLAFLW